MTCFLQLEWYMRNGLLRQEVASIIIEQNNDLQKRIKEVYRVALSNKILTEVDTERGNISHKILPITRVIDEPSFQEKTVASIL